MPNIFITFNGLWYNYGIQANKAEAMPPFKTSPIEFNQRLMFPSNVFDLLKEDHECYLYSSIFEQLDTTELEKQFKTRGQNAYHPRLIISILIYAYSRGVFSSREIERRCNEDLSFMYIAKMHCPNFRVLSDFRKNNATFFHDCFKQTVKIAMELQLANLGHISLDGSKFKANSSKHKAMSYARLKEKEQALSEEIEALIKQASESDAEEDQAYKDRTGFELPADLKHKESQLAKVQKAKVAIEKREEALNPGKPIEGTKQISFADEDARIMGKNGYYEYSYNVQISVDSEYQVIIGQHLSQNSNDKKEFEPALQEVKDTTGKYPDKMSADNGYMSGGNLQSVEKTPVDTYIATDKGEKKNKTPLTKTNRKLVKADFEYDQGKNIFTCPGGQTLTQQSESKDGKRTYHTEAKICQVCQYHARCCKSQKGKPRTISCDDKEPLRQQMNDKMETDTSKAIYKERKVIVEPVFGQIKNTGFKGFSVRGKEKVAGELSLVCAVHNIKKIAKAIIQGVVCPKNGKLVINHAI